MGQLKAIAINESASLCVDKDGEPIQMPCCEDISEELKVEEITQVSFDFDSQPDLYELAIITWITLGMQNAAELENLQLQYYAPPPPDNDFKVNLQVFLI